MSFTLPEAGLKELQSKALALGGTACSPVDSIAALLEKTLTDLRVSFRAAVAHLKKINLKKVCPRFTLTLVEGLGNITAVLISLSNFLS